MFYNTIQELDALLTQHFQNKEPYSLEHKLVTNEVMQIIIKNGNNIVYETVIDAENPDVILNTNDKALKDWFYDQWWEYKQKSKQLPSVEGDDITLGDKVFITDPCYEPNIWCQALLENVKPGTWHTEMEKVNEGVWGTRVSALTVWHSDFDKPTEFQETDEFIGVDSGQAGVVNYNHFIQLNNNENEKERWYDDIETFIQVRKPLTPAMLYKLEEFKAIRLKMSEYLENKQIDQFQELYRQSLDLEYKYGFTPRTIIDSKKDGYEHQLWTDDKSVITSTGYGDGSYDCSIAKNGDQIIGIKITYISDEEDED